MMQTNKKLLTVITILTVMLIVGIFIWANQGEKHAKQMIEQSKDTVSQTLPQYDASEIALHGNMASCWTVIDGSVYDLTEFVNRHPGGDKAILSVCGVDGSAIFKEAHHGSAKKTATLQEYVVGVLR